MYNSLHNHRHLNAVVALLLKCTSYHSDCFVDLVISQRAELITNCMVIYSKVFRGSRVHRYWQGKQSDIDNRYFILSLNIPG